MSNQTKNTNLNFLIDPTFSKGDRLFVLSFENERDRTSFSQYYTPIVGIEGFKVLIDGKRFFDTSIIIKKHTKRLLKWEGIMTTQQVICSTTNIFQSIAN